MSRSVLDEKPAPGRTELPAAGTARSVPLTVGTLGKFVAGTERVAESR